MNRLRIIAPLALVTLLAGCMPPLELRSHTYDRDRVPDRLLVVQTMMYTVREPKVSNGFKTEIARLLDACGVPTAFSVNNETPGKSLFAGDTVAPYADVETDKINELKPNFVLSVRELTTTTQGTITIVDMEAVLTDRVRKKPVWRANGFIRKTPLLNRVTLEDFARALVDKMRTDNILRTCPASLDSSPKKG